MVLLGLYRQLKKILGWTFPLSVAFKEKMVEQEFVAGKFIPNVRTKMYNRFVCY